MAGKHRVQVQLQVLLELSVLGARLLRRRGRPGGEDPREPGMSARTARGPAFLLHNREVSKGSVLRAECHF